MLASDGEVPLGEVPKVGVEVEAGIFKFPRNCDSMASHIEQVVERE